MPRGQYPRGGPGTKAWLMERLAKRDLSTTYKCSCRELTERLLAWSEDAAMFLEEPKGWAGARQKQRRQEEQEKIYGVYGHSDIPQLRQTLKEEKEFLQAELQAGDAHARKTHGSTVRAEADSADHAQTETESTAASSMDADASHDDSNIAACTGTDGGVDAGSQSSAEDELDRFRAECGEDCQEQEDDALLFQKKVRTYGIDLPVHGLDLRGKRKVCILSECREKRQKLESLEAKKHDAAMNVVRGWQVGFRQSQLLQHVQGKAVFKLNRSQKNSAYYIADEDDNKMAILKPDPVKAKYEVAGYMLSETLGLHCVPVTLEGSVYLQPSSGPLQLYSGSLQQWTLGGSVLDFAEDGLDVPAAETVAVLDICTGNGDRHPGNLMRKGDILIGIDHGEILPPLRLLAVKFEAWRDMAFARTCTDSLLATTSRVVLNVPAALATLRALKLPDACLTTFEVLTMLLRIAVLEYEQPLSAIADFLESGKLQGMLAPYLHASKSNILVQSEMVIQRHFQEQTKALLSNPRCDSDNSDSDSDPVVRGEQAPPAGLKVA